MSDDAQVQYHADRAMREMDQGLSAGCLAAARSHMQLSSLHLARMRALLGSEAEADGLRQPLIRA